MIKREMYLACQSHYINPCKRGTMRTGEEELQKEKRTCFRTVFGLMVCVIRPCKLGCMRVRTASVLLNYAYVEKWKVSK